MSSYDLVVIGGGTAGLVAAADGASLGANVALIEQDRLGGDCLHYGCVPTKTLVKSAKVASLMRRAEEFGLKSVEAEVDFPAVMERMRRTIATIGVHDDPDRFRELGVKLYLGDRAHFESPKDISVDGSRLEAQRVIVATGSHATVPHIAGLVEAGYITHVEALRLERRPSSMVIVGAGPIGCEFTQIFARFGCRVTLLDSSPLPLPKEDPEIGEALLSFLKADGIVYHGGYRAEEARVEGNEKVIVARDRSGERIEARGEEILIATGRAPTFGGLGLENAGGALVRNGVMVDEQLRTSAPGITPQAT